MDEELTLQDIYDFIEYHSLTPNTAFWIERDSTSDDLPVGEIVFEPSLYHVYFYADGSQTPVTIKRLEEVMSEYPDVDPSEISIYADDNEDNFPIGEFAFLDEGCDGNNGAVLYFEV